MTTRSEGFDYAPQAHTARPVVAPGEFNFAAAFLDHGHINGQCNGLLEAGATLKCVYDPDEQKVAAFLRRFPGSAPKVARHFDEILSDGAVQLVAAAAVPCVRGPIGLQVMRAGKDYFTDKCPFTTLEQLRQAEQVVAETGRKFMVYYSERLHVEAAWHAGEMIRQGAIGRVLHIAITGPHRLSAPSRPAWFFEKQKYGGILTDIGSHQFEQFLHYADAKNGTVLHARVDNFAHPEHPELEDFGEAVLKLDNGISCHSRVDWFTPSGLSTWGDGRTLIVGTTGFMEIRKYVDLAQPGRRNRIFLVDGSGEHLIECDGKVGFPYFGRLVRDCHERSSTAMTQEHAFKAAELSLNAQAIADTAR